MKIKLRRSAPRIKPAADPLTVAGSWRDNRTSSTARGYGYEWQQARAEYLAAHPLCVMCQALGVITAATVVDHIKPHRGDMVLFWLISNWQALCITCHNKHKQRMEARTR